MFRGETDMEKFTKERLNQIRLMHYLSFIPELTPSSRVLDLGCGEGYIDKFLKTKYGCEVWCIDLKREESHEWIRDFKMQGIAFLFCDIARVKYLPFPSDYFNLVLFCEVLEHLITQHPPKYLFREIYRVLKLNGILFLSTPNMAELVKRLRLLIGKHPIPRVHFKDEDRPYAGHYREYTLDELKYLLSEMGFKILKIRLRDYSPYYGDKTIIRKLYSMILKLVPTFRTTIQISAMKVKE